MQREIKSLQRKHSDTSQKIASNSQKIVDLKNSLRTSNVSSAQNKLRQINSLEKDIAKLQANNAKFDADIAKKTETLYQYQNALTKEQQLEQNKALKNLERRQAAKLDARARVSESATMVPVEYDVFISHASEDKDDLVRPLAEELVKLGLKVWYDELTLKVGDSLRRSIDNGLLKSRFGIVVLSPSFLAKNWPEYELNGLIQQEMKSGGKVILPLWHKVSKSEMQNYSLPLADKVALNSTMYTISELASEFASVIKDVSRKAVVKPSILLSKNSAQA
ncbi:MAG: TIR domain-containing protein [Prochloron sp. SP5CPC1]|nr:TIR domain-containing protein [Candidatus Paraprochloron terpiosi SP5CPC1]